MKLELLALKWAVTGEFYIAAFLFFPFHLTAATNNCNIYPIRITYDAVKGMLSNKILL